MSFEDLVEKARAAARQEAKKEAERTAVAEAAAAEAQAIADEIAARYTEVLMLASRIAGALNHNKIKPEAYVLVGQYAKKYDAISLAAYQAWGRTRRHKSASARLRDEATTLLRNRRICAWDMKTEVRVDNIRTNSDGAILSHYDTYSLWLDTDGCVHYSDSPRNNEEIPFKHTWGLAQHDGLHLAVIERGLAALVVRFGIESY